MTLRNPRRIDVNQPFEFEEAIVNPAERSRIGKVSAAQALFDGFSSRTEVRDFQISPFSIRLRTINNARDSMVSLPDGTPLTEISIYGSRDRHYILGSYSAVKRIMGGSLPDAQIADPAIAVHRSKITGSVGSAIYSLKAYIAQVESGERVMRVELAFGVREARLVQLAREDLGALKVALAKLEKIYDDIPPVPKPVPPGRWWLDWTPAPGLDELKPSFDSVTDKMKAILEHLENEVR